MCQQLFELEATLCTFRGCIPTKLKQTKMGSHNRTRSTSSGKKNKISRNHPNELNTIVMICRLQYFGGIALLELVVCLLFLAGEDPLSDSECDLDSVAGVLKLYFRGLEPPLFPYDSYNQLLECVRKFTSSRPSVSVFWGFSQDVCYTVLILLSAENATELVLRWINCCQWWLTHTQQLHCHLTSNKPVYWC